MSTAPQVPGVEARAQWRDGCSQVPTPDAVDLLARLQRDLGPCRLELSEVLLDARSTPGNDAGVRSRVGSQDLESWWHGGGAVAIVDLLEDAATAGISRSQIRQWVHDGVSTEEGAPVTADFVRQVEDEELEKVEAVVGEDVYAKGRYGGARELFEQVALADDVELLILPAYERRACRP